MQANTLAEKFPDVDATTIAETLELCDGDADKCASVLSEVLAEEAANAPPSMLRTLLDSVSLIAQVPRAQQDAAQRDRILMLCGGLEVNGIRLLQPVSMLLDGVRDRETVTAGLDEADRVVVLQLIDLIEGGGGSVDGLSLSERSALTAEFGSESERAHAASLERTLAEKRALLAQKEQELLALKHAAIKQRMGGQVEATSHVEHVD